MEIFHLQTKNTSYLFRVLLTGQLEHLYYGESLQVKDESEFEPLFEQHEFAPGNSPIYDQDHPQYTLDDMRLECSGEGKGDYREPFVSLVFADGSRTTDFVFDSFEWADTKAPLNTLPSTYEDDGQIHQLTINLRERNHDVLLKLVYSAFVDRDVIVRSAILVNNSDENVQIERLMSNQLDFFGTDKHMTVFTGSWISEMRKHTFAIEAGTHSVGSTYGTSSSRANPFVMLHDMDATEAAGEVIGCNLVYSGNHLESAQATSFGKIRFIQGINPDTFSWCLEPGQQFESPETVMAYSNYGFSGMSSIMHNFVNNCVVRGKWKNRPRPVLCNSWEASYFDISERSLVRLGRAARDCGIELLVMDDGWFGNRNDDSSSLGDWFVNKNKLPGGLSNLADKINELGLDFGIWVEPEMVSENSELYNMHPDWALGIPGQNQSLGRNQMILDLTNPEVVDYIIDAMTNVFQSANISYVKWDMNRTFTDYFSQHLNAERQGELIHRYYIGLYRIMEELVKRFPEILFEGCSSGGNRFDLGILSYFPQIWGSDNTDACCRVDVQNSYSYGYPQSTLTAHVSDVPNHQTLRSVPLASRFNVAAFGNLGYELDLSVLPKDQLLQIRKQVELYKEWRQVLQYGQFSRGQNGNIMQWSVTNAEKTHAVGMIFQKLVQPNWQFHNLCIVGLEPGEKYIFKNVRNDIDIHEFGSLVNGFLPIKIRRDSALFRLISKLHKLPSEEEMFKTTGSVLGAGVNLKQAYSATGFNDNTRHFQDFASRLYLVEKLSAK